MTPNEFKQWLDHAVTAYQEISKGFHGDRGIKRSEMWQEALEGVRLGIATEAIDAMICGHLQHPRHPNWTDDLPKLILDFNRERMNDELTSDARWALIDEVCPKCLNCQSGVVTIWNPWFVDDCREQISLCTTPQEVFQLHRSWRMVLGWKNPVHGKPNGNGLRLTVLCNCSNPTAVRKRQRLEEFRAGKDPKHVPAVHDTFCESMAIWERGDPKEVCGD